MELLLVILFLLYSILFLISIKLQDNSIVDIFWGIGFVVISWGTYLQSIGNSAQMVMTLLVTAWGIRLALHIGSKKLSHNSEDARYKRWRDTWKYFYLRSYFQVFLLQGIIMLFIAYPIYLLNFETGFLENNTFTLWGGFIALFGLLYETIADTELKQFIRTKKEGEILILGLRKFHRYPQYFGESVFWFGICIIASQIHFSAFIGWGVITFLLLFVSGVPLLEARYKDNETYAIYAKETPLIFPNWGKVLCSSKICKK